MKLSQYLKQQGISLPKFAEIARVPYQTLYTTVHRPWIVPNADLALRIVEATGGQVSLQDLVIKSKYPRWSPGQDPGVPESGTENQESMPVSTPACG